MRSSDPKVSGASFPIPPSSDETLVALAESLGLKKEVVEPCFSGRRALERVLTDIYDAQESGVQTAPSFIVLQAGKGTMLRGTKPAEAFVSTLRKFLDAANAEKPKAAEASK